jgi:hypothetical protein
MPQLSLIAINIAGFVVGLTRDADPTGTVVCLLLCSVHSLLLLRVVIEAFRDRSRTRPQARPAAALSNRRTHATAAPPAAEMTGAAR